MKTRQIYALATNATTNDLAHLDFVQSSRIKALAWEINGVAPNDGDRLRFELSTAAAAQMTTNDARDIVDVCGLSFDLVTSGASSPNVQKQTLLDISIPAGGRLYLHQIGVVGGSAAYAVRVIVHLA